MTTQQIRRLNKWLALAWLAMVPVAIVTGWIESIIFISAASIYANFVSHWAAQRADEPDPEVIGRLDDILDLLEEAPSAR